MSAASRASPRHEVVWFVGLTVAVSSVFYVLVARAGDPTAGGQRVVLGLMGTPGVVALALQLWSRRSLEGLGPGRSAQESRQ